MSNIKETIKPIVVATIESNVKLFSDSTIDVNLNINGSISDVAKTVVSVGIEVKRMWLDFNNSRFNMND